MLWGLELDRRLRAAASPLVTQLTHPGWVASNLSNLGDSPLMSLAHKGSRRWPTGWPTTSTRARRRRCTASASRFPGSYVGVSGRFGLRGGPVLIGRTQLACDYDTAARLVAFAERETGTKLEI